MLAGDKRVKGGVITKGKTCKAIAARRVCSAVHHVCVAHGKARTPCRDARPSTSASCAALLCLAMRIAPVCMPSHGRRGASAADAPGQGVPTAAGSMHDPMPHIRSVCMCTMNASHAWRQGTRHNGIEDSAGAASSRACALYSWRKAPTIHIHVHDILELLYVLVHLALARCGGCRRRRRLLPAINRPCEGVIRHQVLCTCRVAGTERSAVCPRL